MPCEMIVFERDDRAAVCERLLHPGCDVQIFVQIHIKNLLVDSSDRFALYSFS